jgi:hypothetical protein
MDVLIKKIEDAIYETHENIVTGSHDHYYTNKITSSVLEKLNGHYYVIMYGKRKAENH